MSRLREENLKKLLLSYVTALLLGGGMVLCLCRAFLPDQSPLPALLICALSTAIFEGFFALRFRWKWVFFGGALLLFSGWAALGGGPFFPAAQWVKAFLLTFRGMPDAALPYGDVARLALSLFFSFLGASLSREESLAPAVFCLSGTAVLSFLLGDAGFSAVYLLPGAAGLLMLLARKKSLRFSALPVALLLSLLAFLCLPARLQTAPSLEKTARRIRQFVEDYLFFNEYRTAFSLADAGYQPLDERLGGRAEPENRSVMEVTAAHPVLLRGRAYDAYSGLSWYDSLSARRYLYSSPRFASQRDLIFDLNRPLNGEEGIAPESIRIHMLSQSPTTLFVPQHMRTVQLESERMVLYYNLAGELFLTRDFQPGDTYTLTYLPLSPENAATERLIEKGAQTEDPYYRQICDIYLSLPGHIQKEIYDIAEKAVRGAETPYEKALAIQKYLQRHYRYTLDVKEPPDSVDFAAWFLLGEKEGYCTYFATAMTVLCRIAGVPARYVTGYVASPDASGVALVTGKEAHAWTEVYLNGFGWLDFDATPRSENSERGGEEPAGGEENENGPDMPSPSPTALMEPEETPSPAPEASPSPAPQEQEQPTPEVSPDSRQSPEPDASPFPDPSSAPPKEPFPWHMLLALFLLMLLLLWRYWMTEPIRRAKRHPGQEMKIYFDAVSLILSGMKIQRRPSETLHDFAFRADEALKEKGWPALSPLAFAHAASVYGKRAADPEMAKACYLAMRDSQKLFARICTAVKRMICGNRPSFS